MTEKAHRPAAPTHACARDTAGILRLNRYFTLHFDFLFLLFVDAPPYSR
jgi:hypothetical protein